MEMDRIPFEICALVHMSTMVWYEVGQFSRNFYIKITKMRQTCVIKHAQYRAIIQHISCNFLQAETLTKIVPIEKAESSLFEYGDLKLQAP